TEKKEERKLTEDEWHWTMEDVLMLGYKMSMKKFNEEVRTRGQALKRLFNAKNDYEEKKDGRALEEVVDYAKKALNQLVE
ncbi:hypothetical protein PENTCL1PPCAC_19238, partial [Pristionchus entomophagus]